MVAEYLLNVIDMAIKLQKAWTYWPRSGWLGRASKDFPPR